MNVPEQLRYSSDHEWVSRDGDVVRIIRRGFLWRSRIFRPEEVVIRKWKEGFLVALQPAVAK